jgi:DNA-binding transcriptional ArsR family regulator
MMIRSKFHWEELGVRMAPVFKAFGDLNRMKIIKILASNPEHSLCVSEIADMIGITQPATSQHIKVLSNSGILVPKRIKNRTYYSIDSKQLQEYNEIIDHMFRMAFVRCEFEGDCDNCPIRKDCYIPVPGKSSALRSAGF